jgi:hypothetical protein
MPRKRNKNGFLWIIPGDVVLFLRLFPIRIQSQIVLHIFRKAKNVESRIDFLKVYRWPVCCKNGLTGLRDSQTALRTWDCSIL